VQIGDGGGEVPAEVNKRGLGKLGAGAQLYLPNQWYLRCIQYNYHMVPLRAIIHGSKRLSLVRVNRRGTASRSIVGSILCCR
jgi:hypothetical protein